MDIVQRVADEFTVKYDGEALSEHIMDVRTLAPSLMALGDALLAAHDALEEPGHAPTLRIQATREGSFDVNLLVDVLSSPATTSVANTIAMSQGGATIWQIVQGAIRRLNWGVGREVGDPNPASESGMITFTDADGNSLTVPVGTETIIENGQFRAAMSSFTQPLDDEGIDKVAINSGVDQIVIDEGSRERFRFEPRETTLDETTRLATVHVETVQLSADHSRKWRFSENGETFAATVEDNDFLLGVRSGRRPVGAEDRLRIRIREVTIKRPTGGVRIDRTVVEVLDHVRAPIQEEFDYGE